MFKLTLLLCAALFVALLIGGEDHGQLRPGLAAAMNEPRPVAPDSEAGAETVAAAAAPAAVPADAAPATAPVVVEAPVVAGTPAAQTAPASQTAVVSDQPDSMAAPDGDDVFSLANFSDTPATPATAPTETDPTETAAASGADLAVVSARSVNVRSGPGTDFDVLTRLGRGEMVTRIGDAGNGWALIRIEGDGVEGYVSTDYLAAP